MERRELFRVTAGAAVAAKLAGAQAHKFFSDDEFKMTDELTEMIIPADDKSGGARAAQVAAYLDFRLSEAFEPQVRDQWREGLKSIDALSTELNGHAFLAATPEQRIALITRLSEKNDEFFRVLKEATIRAYYTSKIGIHDDLDYKGNVYQRGDYAGELP